MNTQKHIGINGLFLRKPGSGIGVVTALGLGELLKQLPTDIRCTIYVDEETKGEQGHFVYIKPWWYRDDRIRKLLWEHIQLPKRALAQGVTHFLSLYQAPTEFPKEVQHTMIVHDIIPELFPEYVANGRSRLMWNLTKRAIAKTTRIVAVSRSTKSDLEKYFQISAEKITVAYPSINPIFFQEQTQQEIEEVLHRYHLEPGYLYHGGGLEIRKNTESLLAAYAAWRKSVGLERNVPPLVISGLIHGQENPLATDVRGLLKKLQIEDQVVLLGFVPDADLPVLYSQASVFVYPSRYEGFGMPLVEALSQGTAVVAERNSSLGEVGGECVFWHETLTKDVLAVVYQQGLKSSLEEKNVRRLQAARFGSWTTFAQKIIDTLIQ